MLGDARSLANESVTREPRVECRELSAGVYSPLEQLSIPRSAPAETSIFWSPNVNVPVVHPGRLLVTVHDAFYFGPPAGVRTRLDKRLYLGFLVRSCACLPERCCAFRSSRKASSNASGTGRARFTWSKAASSGIGSRSRTARRPWPKPYLVYVGNLKPHKNLPRTLAAFARIAGRFRTTSC